MQISFQFNPEKALQVVAFFLRRTNGPVDKAKLMKLVYLSDRQSFIDHGVPITGDRPYAMKLGPVPSDTLHLIDGELYAMEERVYDFIHLNNREVSLVKNPGDNLLTRHESTILESVWNQHGHKATIPLCEETHKLPEYVEKFVAGTSTLIPYECIAKHSKNPARYRLGRPVISPETAASMKAPFPPEPDL